MRPRFHRRGEGSRTRHELLFAQDDTLVYSIHFFEMAPFRIDVIPNGFSREEPAFGLEPAMTLTINGEDRDLPNITTLADLVSHLGMKPDRVAIELNRELVRRERWPETKLSSGDKLEIVHFVGGGS